MTQILFRNFRLLEPGHGELRGGYELLVENDRVRECGDGPIKSSRPPRSSTAAGAP